MGAFARTKARKDSAMFRSPGCWIGLMVLAMSAGCRSPYYADQGALAGGVGGAGLGALIGSASGHAGAGAAIGAVAGRCTGGAVGGALDDIDARNRAQIAASMNRPVNPGAATVNDVIAMTHAGVDENLIVNHVTANGLVRPLQSNDVIYLQQNGVSPRDRQHAGSPRASCCRAAGRCRYAGRPAAGGYGRSVLWWLLGAALLSSLLRAKRRRRRGRAVGHKNPKIQTRVSEFSCRPSPAVIAGSIMTLPYVDGFFTTVRPLEFATPNRALLAGDLRFSASELAVIGYLQFVRVVDNGTSNGFTDIAVLVTLILLGLLDGILIAIFASEPLANRVGRRGVVGGGAVGSADRRLRRQFEGPPGLALDAETRCGAGNQAVRRLGTRD